MIAAATRRALVLLACAAAPALAAQPFAARPGAWEMTITSTFSGDPLPPEALAKVPPEKREMVQKMIAERAGKPNTATRETCVTTEDLKRDSFLRNENFKCTNQVVSRSPTRIVTKQTCAGPPASTGTMTFEAKTPESVVGTIDHDRDLGKVHVEIAGRWLSASCDGVSTPGTRALEPPMR